MQPRSRLTLLRCSAFLALALGMIPWSLAAEPRPRPDRTKVLVSWADGRNARVASTEASLGGEEVASYASYRIISLPPEAIEHLAEKLRGTGLTFAVRDDFDVLSLPGGRIDTREGLDPAIPASELIGGYPGGTTGLYVVQLIGPSVPDWMRQIEEAGARIVGYLPQNGYLLGATPDGSAAVEGLPFVQWLGPYHPFHKAKSVNRRGAGLRVIDVEIADIEGAADSIAELRRLDPTARETARYANRIVLRARVPAAAIDRLLADGRVIGVAAAPDTRLSDERQAMATWPGLEATSNQPTNPTAYRTWLHGVRPILSNLASDGFVVGIADTGLDGGNAPGYLRHPDLASPANRMRYGGNFTSNNNRDNIGHGTMVAGIIAGDASTGARDNNGTGFYLGMGIAPTAAIHSTKMATDQGTAGWGTIFDWAADATNAGVRIQNHSHNDYSETDGLYTANTALYDAAVRDSNGASPGGAPITLTVSAGNTDQGGGRRTMAPATAKNVISVGGAESYRDAANEQFNCRGTAAGGFKNVMSTSRHGTRVSNMSELGQPYQWSTYIKPDLTAVASSVAAPRTSSTYSLGWCQTSFNGHPYLVDSGTSYAAPVAAGAAVLASRVYSEFASPGSPNPTLASPALIKAMLIGTARSMEGGHDNATPGLPVIGPRPNDVQGFGLVNVGDLIEYNVAKAYVNQTHTFAASGEAGWNGIYYRRDTNRPVRVALTWTDAPAAASSPTPLVNDLDLTVDVPYSHAGWAVGAAPFPCSVVYWGNNITTGDQSQGIPCNATSYGLGHDFRNNAELVVLQPGEANQSEVFVNVHPKQIQAPANPAVAGNNQDFALYVFNASPRGDFDQEGKTDLVWQSSAGTSYLWLGASPSRVVSLQHWSPPGKIGAVGDFDKNGSDDFVLLNPSTGEVKLWLMSKTDLIGSVALPSTADLGWQIQGAGDFNRDGNLDIAWRNYGPGPNTGLIRVWLMAGTSLDRSLDITNLPELNWHIEGVADFNGDGGADFFWHNYVTGETAFWIMNGVQITSGVLITNVPRIDWHVGAVGDFNNDGFNDVIWRNVHSGGVLAWYGRRAVFPTSAWLAWSTDPSLELVGPR